MNFCVFDLETTGLNPDRGAEPIEVGGVRIVRGELSNRFQSFVCPEGRIPRKVQELTGIGPEDVREAPSVSSVFDDFLRFVDDAVLVAHNVDFDRGFLEMYAPRPVNNEEIDTLCMARVLLNQQDHSLDQLVRQFGLDRKKSHRALDDAHATAELFLSLAVRIQTYGDYRRCGIPRRVRREDLKLIQKVVEGPGQLTEHYGNTSAVLRTNGSDLAERLELETQEARELQKQIESLYEDPEMSLHPPIHWTNSFRIRYWKTSNYVVNAVGTVLIVGALVATESKRFYAFILTALPFFLTSPLIAYAREKNVKLFPRSLVVAVVFLVWLIVLFGLGSLNIVLAEWRSILTSGG